MASLQVQRSGTFGTAVICGISIWQIRDILLSASKTVVQQLLAVVNGANVYMAKSEHLHPRTRLEAFRTLPVSILILMHHELVSLVGAAAEVGLLNCMFRYPEVFHTGIAIAFVADQRTYDTIYQERYMNTPQDNPDGYRKGSPITYAEGLKGNLLLIHGTGDDNVHYQNCEMLVNKLVEYGKIFSQLSYPLRSHSISERPGTTLHLRMSMADYWLKNLPAGGG